LAAVAIPAYNDYTQTTKASAGIAGLSSYKTVVAMCYQKEGALADCDSGEKGIPKAITAAGSINYLTAVAVTNGVITATLEAKDRNSNPIDISITPEVGTGTGTINWVVGCSDFAADADADPSYVESCSQTVATTTTGA